MHPLKSATSLWPSRVTLRSKKHQQRAQVSGARGSNSHAMCTGEGGMHPTLNSEIKNSFLLLILLIGGNNLHNDRWIHPEEDPSSGQPDDQPTQQHAQFWPGGSNSYGTRQGAVPPTALILRGTIVNRTYRTHKNLYLQHFLLTIFGPVNYGPPY